MNLLLMVQTAYIQYIYNVSPASSIFFMFWLRKPFNDFKTVVDDGEMAFIEFSMQMKDERERIEFSF